MTSKGELIRAIGNSKLSFGEIIKRLKRCSKKKPALDRILSKEDASPDYKRIVGGEAQGLGDILKGMNYGRP